MSKTAKMVLALIKYSWPSRHLLICIFMLLVYLDSMCRHCEVYEDSWGM